MMSDGVAPALLKLILIDAATDLTSTANLDKRSTTASPQSGERM
jgi:hypothetical protein